MYETILSPVEIGGLTLKNRIVFAPTSLGLKGEELEQKITAIAEGGCAMIIIGDVPVSDRGFFRLSGKKGFAHYKRLCELIHAGGSLACAQLHQSDSDVKGMLRYIPGLLTKKITAEELRHLLNQQTGRYITQLSSQKVSAITSSFGKAAVLAKQAGFDMIQIHGDRMCGSFSSGIYNERTDSYGGSPEKRAHFAVEAVSAVRQALPHMTIEYKLAVRQENPHYGNAGILTEELPVFIPMLEKAGVNSFHVVLADHSSLTDTIPPANHPYFGEEGCFLRYCDCVRKITKLPVCGVGGLTDPDFVEQQLADGRIAYAAMSRQLIADPAWPDKLRSGQKGNIRRCVRCNAECLGGIQKHRGVRCIYDKAEP